MTLLSGLLSRGSLLRRAAVAALLVGAGAACETYLGPDGALDRAGGSGERPVLTALELRPDTVVDVTPGTASLTLSVGARSVQGVEEVTVTLGGPGGEASRNCSAAGPVEGDATEGVWACSATFQVDDPLGAWALDRVQVEGVDTTATFGAQALADAGYRTTFRVRRDPAEVVSLEVAPRLDTLESAGAVLPLQVTANNQYGEVMASPEVAWSSTAPEVASVDEAGRVVALRPGTARIAARSGTEADTATVVVDFDLVLTSVRVTPDSAVVSRPGATAAFAARALSQVGEPLPGEHPATWSVSDTSVASVSLDGVVTSRAAGETRVEARIGDRVGSARFLVRSAPARLVVTPRRDTVPEKEMAVLFATVFDAFGAELDVSVTWTAADTTVARVDTAGVVTGVRSGVTQVVASVGELRDSARVWVVRRRPSRVLVEPATDTVPVDGVARFQARVLDQLGEPLDAEVAWRTLDPDVAQVTGSGIATGMAPGVATLVAEAGKAAATATLVVEGDGPAGIRWIEPDGGLWSRGENWEGGVAPGPGDLAVIDLPGTYTVEVAEPTTVGSLRMPGGESAATLAVRSALTLETGGSAGSGSELFLDGELTTHGVLTLAGQTRWENGRLAGEGLLDVAGTLTLSGGGVDRRLLDGLAVENRGTVNWLYGPLTMVGPGALTNLPGGAFLLQPEIGELGWGEGPMPVVDNRGTLVRRGEGPLWVEAELRNSGTVELDGSWLSLRGPATGEGRVLLQGSGSILELDGEGERRFGPGSSLEGEGRVSVAGGVLALEGTLDAGRLELMDGTLEVAGAGVRRAGRLDVDVTTTLRLSGGAVLEATDAATWSGGRVEGDGTLRAAAGAVFVLEGSDGRTLGGSVLLENLGTMRFLEGPLFMEGTAGVANRTGGTLRLLTASALPRDGAEAFWLNEGLVEVLGGDGFRLDAPFENRGRVVFGESGIFVGSDFTHAPGAVLAGTGGMSLAEASDVTISGTLSPGLSPGFLVFLGELPLSPEARVVLEVTSPVSDESVNDAIQVDGPATLDGTLELQVAPELILEPGQVVPLMAFTGREGDFADTTGVPPGMEVAVSDSMVVLRMAAVAPPDDGEGPFPGVDPVKLLKTGTDADPAAALGVGGDGIPVGWSESGGARNAVQWPFGDLSGLGTLGGPGPHQAFAMNSLSEIVGASGKDGVGTVPFLYRLGTMTELAGLGEAVGEARDIGIERTVVGWTRAFGPSERAFVWTEAGGPTDLGTLGGDASRAYGVSGNDVVGWAENGAGQRRAVLWHLGDPLELGTLGGSWSEARDVNGNGTVVGFAETADGSVHAFLWTQLTGMMDLGTLGGAESRAYAINGSGVVVGMARNAEGAVRAARWIPEVGIQDLGTLTGGASSEARGISDTGQVVGFGTDADGNRWALSWPAVVVGPGE